MAVKVTNSEGKILPAKKTISLKDIDIKKSKFVDDSGDITEEILGAIPDCVDSVNFKIVVSVPEE